MKKKYLCKIDGDDRDCIIIDNENSNSSLFFIEVKNYDIDTGEEYSTCVGITKEEALNLANEIIKTAN